MRCVEATFEPGRTPLSDGEVQADRKHPEKPSTLVVGESMSPSKAKLQVRQLLAARYPANLEESLVAALEEVASIDVLVGDLKGEADWDLSDLTRGPDLGSRASID